MGLMLAKVIYPQSANAVAASDSAKQIVAPVLHAKTIHAELMMPNTLTAIAKVALFGIREIFSRHYLIINADVQTTREFA